MVSARAATRSAIAAARANKRIVRQRRRMNPMKMVKKRSMVSAQKVTRIPSSPATVAAKTMIARASRMSPMKMNNKRKNATYIWRRSVKRCCMTVKAAALPFLPMDIIASILSWLPVKSLVRFRCVCKQWRSLTYDPNFVTTHYHRSLALARLALISPRYISNLTLYDLSEHGEVRDLSFDVRLFGEPTCYAISNSVNGLVCAYRNTSSRLKRFIKGRDDYHYLLNPSSREIVKLPMSSRESWGCGGTNVGLGFDVSTGGYKLVRVFGKEGDSECSCFEVLELGLGSSGAAREWRYVGEATCRNPSDTPVLFNGALHWAVMGCYRKEANSTWARHYVLAFDVTNERFRLMQTPKSLLEMWLMESSGHLCLVKSPEVWKPRRSHMLSGLKREDLKPGPDARKLLGSKHFLTIWMLQDYENGKWIQEHNIDMFDIAATSDYEPAIVGLRGHEILFLVRERRNRSIFAYDLRTMTLRELYPEPSAKKLNFIRESSAKKLNFIRESLVSPISLAGNLALPP